MSKYTFDPTIYNLSQNQPISAVLEKEITRRGMLKSGTAATALSIMTSMGLVGCKGSDSKSAKPKPIESKPAKKRPLPEALDFESIKNVQIDAVSVPEGYLAYVLAPWGTPLNDQARPWKSDGSNSSKDQLNAVGMNHDGMHFFPIGDGKAEGILCINHEYLELEHLHPLGEDDQTSYPKEERARKEINAHGVSVVHIRKIGGIWEVAKNSKYNRRITAGTEILVSGPIAESDLKLLQTKYTEEKNNHKLTRGTMNNCGNGHTPWGTYLTCEENWPGYFVRRDDEETNWTAAQIRIGIRSSRTKYGWEKAKDELETGEFSRFDLTPTGSDASSDFRNEANGVGYIVEIDPYDASKKAIKRTALGRFRHEDCSFGLVQPGKPVVFYSGDDTRFEYIYKFVSKAGWNPADAHPKDRMATGSKYMDEGTLYVARFDEDGKGAWLALTPDSTTKDGRRLGDIEGFQSLAEIILNTRGAADLLGATSMDRPEWTAVDPRTGHVYVTLSKNHERDNSQKPNLHTNAANPRENNVHGHIIRWQETDDHERFEWEFFLFGSSADKDLQVNRSGLTDANQMAGPDGLAFDDRGILWIQTDDSSLKDSNDQMLAVIPGQLGKQDYRDPVINPKNQAQLKRFLVGPNGCEITGLAHNQDYSSFFVNIQHPDNWPTHPDATVKTPKDPKDKDKKIRARSSTVVIMKKEGGEVGLS